MAPANRTRATAAASAVAFAFFPVGEGVWGSEGRVGAEAEVRAMNLAEHQHHTQPDGAGDVLAGRGELAARMRALDWSRTTLGPVARWPQSLKTAVRIMLTSSQPMFVWWGDELINLYNDAYKAIVGGKHPAALGQPASVVWHEIWDQVGPRAATAMQKNEGTYDEALLLIMERNGYEEETYYTFSYSPVPNDQGGPGGIICANTDDTQRVIGERQLALLRELAASTADARTLADACARSVRCLEANAQDIPFAALYLVAADGRRAALAGTCGIARGHPAAPESVPLDGDAPWPFAQVIVDNQLQLVGGLGARFGDLPAGAWPRPPRQAVVVPIAPARPGGANGLLVAGLNPFRLFDDRYRRFVELMAAQIAASLANAQAYEDERRRAESLAELDRAKTAFFSNISHEFRTPLTLMLGPLEDLLVERPGLLPTAEHEQLRVVHRNALRLLKLVNTLLDFSRIEAGRTTAAYEATDLATLTADLASVFRAAVERAGLRLTVACPPLAGPVYVDREMWEKIVLNLLSNAFKYTFAGEIEVALRQAGGVAELTVRDTGTGIPADELPHLFTRFHRVTGARGRTFEGTGIGLALVQELVRLHGGDVRVASEVGHGSTFTVTVPLGSAHLPPDQIAPAHVHPAHSLRGAAFVGEALRWLPDEPAGGQEPDELLSEQPWGAAEGLSPPRLIVADDNADMRAYVQRLLGAEFHLTVVADGEAALAAARAQTPDLVLTDVMMPRLDGFGLLRELRADPRTRDVPVIMLSARAGEEARVEGLEAGADDYLVKPFSARELLARVQTNVALARVRRATSEHERRLREEAEAARAEAEQLYRQAQDAIRVRDIFVSVAAHELKTPLTSLLGQAQLLQRRMSRDGAHDVRQQVGAAVIVSQARRLDRMISALLDIGRIEQGRLSLERAPLDLCALARGVVEEVQPTIERHVVRCELPDAPLVVDGDALRLEQVVQNLVSNAVKYSPGGGEVVVRVSHSGGEARVSVTDTGIGIPADALPQLFTRFYRAPNVEDRRITGMGVGLYVVKEIVTLHGGTVGVTSAEGQGSTFTFTLPARSSMLSA